MAAEVTTRFKYKADLVGREGEPTRVRITRETVHRVTSGGGRRQWQKEGELDRNEPRVEVAELSMAEAVELLASLVDSVSWMAVDHPESKNTAGTQ